MPFGGAPLGCPQGERICAAHQRLFLVAKFKCQVLQWRAQCAKVLSRERERVRNVASALIAFTHAPRALCSRLLPGEVVHHLYAPKDLIRFSPRPADWDALWQACFRAGITRFKQPFCKELWGVWILARRVLQKGLAERQFLPDQVAELLAHTVPTLVKKTLNKKFIPIFGAEAQFEKISGNLKTTRCAIRNRDPHERKKDIS